MTDINEKVKGHGLQLAIFLGLTGAGIIVSVIISGLILLIMLGGHMPSKTDLLQAKYYNVLMVLQAVSTFFVFFTPVYLYAFLCYKRPNRFLGFNLNINQRQLFLVLGILLLTFPLSAALSELTRLIPLPHTWAVKFKQWEETRAAEEAMLIQINSFFKYIVSLFIIALLPGIFEETFFRAGMQNIFTRWFKSPWIAIIVTSIIFSMIHLSFYGFFVRFALGVILGFVYYYSGSLWLSILFHFLFNGVQVTVLYFMNGPGVKKVDDLEKNFPLWIGALALLAVLYLFRKYKEISTIQQAKYVEESIPDDDFSNWASNQPKF